MAGSTVDLTDDRSPEIIAIACVMTGIAVTVVGLKIFVRARMDIHKIGLDDFFIFVSMICSILAASFVVYSASFGLGHHTAAILSKPNGPDLATKVAFYQILGYPFNILAFSLPNVSIAILINNILDRNHWRTRALFMMVILQIIFAIVSIAILFGTCTPVQYLWDKSLDGTCWNFDVINDFSYWLSAYTALTDIMLAAIPIMVFWKLQMRTRTKLGISIMMGLTFLSAIFTVIKATYLWLLFEAEDPLYDVTILVIWGLIEQNIVIVAASVPTLRPFFHKAFRGQKSSQTNTRELSPTPTISTYTRNRGSERDRSVSELPLDAMAIHAAEPSEPQNDDSSNHTSRSLSLRRNIGILRTVDMSMEWSDDREEQGFNRTDRIIPAPLRMVPDPNEEDASVA